MAMSDSTETTLTLDAEQVHAIRRALITGLSSFAEVERIENAVQVERMCGGAVSDECVPIHPTGCAGSAELFATALACLEP